MNMTFKERLISYLDDALKEQRLGKLDLFKYLNEVFKMLYDEINPDDKDGYMIQIDFIDIIAKEIENLEERK